MREVSERIRPKVTFGLVAYNNVDYIGAALQSILDMEKPFEYEVVVCDDGSSDGTLDVVRALTAEFGERLRVLPGDRNPYITVGTGVRVELNKTRLCWAARGEYCLFADGDDTWCDRTFVREAVDILEKDRRFAAVVHSYKMCYPDGETPCVMELREGRVPSAEYFARHYAHYGTFVFRNCLQDAYCRLHPLGCDDIVLQFWIAGQGDFFHRRRIVYAYRQYRGSGWFSTDTNVTDMFELSFLLRALSVSTGALRRAILFRERRFVKRLLSNRKSVETSFRGRDRGFCLATDFLPGSLQDTLCRWSEVSFVRRLVCVCRLAWLYVRGCCCWSPRGK